MDLVNQPSLCSWLFLKHFWLSKLAFCSQWLSVVESVPRPTSISKGRITFSTEMQTSWKLDSQEAAGKVCSEATSREMGIFVCSLWSGPKYIFGERGAPEPINNFFIYYSPVGLLITSPVTEAGGPGFCFPSGSHNSWGGRCVPKLFLGQYWWLGVG